MECQYCWQQVNTLHHDIGPVLVLFCGLFESVVVHESNCSVMGSNTVMLVFGVAGGTSAFSSEGLEKGE